MEHDETRSAKELRMRKMQLCSESEYNLAHPSQPEFVKVLGTLSEGPSSIPTHQDTVIT
jgi:hypothetical protein